MMQEMQLQHIAAPQGVRQYYGGRQDYGYRQDYGGCQDYRGYGYHGHQSNYRIQVGHSAQHNSN